MATIHYCDHKDHDDPDGRFTPAVCHVDYKRMDEKSSNTIHRELFFDACEDHIGALVENTYRIYNTDPLFVSVEAVPYERKK
jgi:hypothetical protein